MGVFSFCVFVSILFVVAVTAESGKDKISWREIPFDDIVTKAEYYTRDLDSILKRRRRGSFELRHEAVVVTTKTKNERWLIEKGDGFASEAYSDSSSYPYKSGDTIATPWKDKQYSYRWTKLKSKELSCHTTVFDFMEAAYLYEMYDIMFSNCQHAAQEMWKLAEQHCSFRNEKISWREIPFGDIVTKAEYYTRSLSRKRRRRRSYGLRHYAVVVTTKTKNERWVIEKEKGFALGAYSDSSSYPYKSGDTIATPWKDKQYSYRWTKLKSKKLSCHATVFDFMKAAYLHQRYSVLYYNCQHAAKNMWKLAEQHCSYDSETSSYGTHDVKMEKQTSTNQVQPHTKLKSLFRASHFILYNLQKECVSLYVQRRNFTSEKFEQLSRRLYCNVVLHLDLKNDPAGSVLLFHRYWRLYHNE